MVQERQPGTIAVDGFTTQGKIARRLPNAPRDSWEED